MVPFWVPNIVQHLIITPKRTLILTTTLMSPETSKPQAGRKHGVDVRLGFDDVEHRAEPSVVICDIKPCYIVAYTQINMGSH